MRTYQVVSWETRLLKRREKQKQKLEIGKKQKLYFNFTSREFNNLNNNCMEYRWIMIALMATSTPQ